MALIFTSWVSQPKPLEWENCYIFLPFTKREKKAKTKRPLWSPKTPLSKAKWLRLHDSCRGLRIGAVKGCVTEVMHQEGSSLTPCLIPVPSSALCLLRECMWPTVSLAGVLEGSRASVSSLHHGQVAFSLVAVTVALHEAEMALCTWGGRLQLAARGEGHPTPCSDLFCPAFRLFQRIWRQVWCPERSDGQGKLLQRAMTSDQAEQPG